MLLGHLLMTTTLLLAVKVVLYFNERQYLVCDCFKRDGNKIKNAFSDTTEYSGKFGDL